MTRTTTQPPPQLNAGEVASAISGYYGVSPSDPGVAKLLTVIYPDVERAAARDPGSWKSVFPGVLAKYESMARDLGLGVSPAQRELDAARIANPTAAGPAGISLAHLAGRHLGNVPLSLRDDAGSRSSAERTAAATRDTSLSVNGAIGYAREIGVNPALAGFFVGGSPEMRDALRSALRDGTSIADEKVKNMNDVSMVIGAIRAGKLKADDPRVPDSVKRIIEDMKTKGIDPATADPKAIKKYFKDNPKALEAVRKDATADLAAKADKSRADIEAESKKLQRQRTATSPGGKPAGKPHQASSTL